MKIQKKRTTLLVMDDCDSVKRAVRRCFDKRFDEIIDASTPAEATSILETRPVTHVLSDLLLGYDSRIDGYNGFAFATFARREFPRIERLVIFTAFDIHGLIAPKEVDAVVSKTDHIGKLIAALLTPFSVIKGGRRTPALRYDCALRFPE